MQYKQLLNLFSLASLTAAHPIFKRGAETCAAVTNGCPDLDFSWHGQQVGIPQYNLDLQKVNWIRDNLYEVTIHVTSEEQIDLKYLYSLKVIGVDGPQGTVQLYGKNENTYLIDNPTDFTSTFQVYADPVSEDDCTVWMPNFQIQFEYMQGDAAQYQDTWKWGQTAFDLMTGCNNHDNQGHSQTDFPGFYWNAQCSESCGVTPPSTCPALKNDCPDLDFSWHSQQVGISQYDLDLESVTYVKDNLYNISIHVTSQDEIDLKYLYSLKVIGVNGPQGTVQLYGKNENTYLIDNPTDFRTSFQVYADPSDDDSCTVTMPNFQIQFEYMQGDAAQYQDTWKWGQTAFDLMTGCNNHDNQGHSQTDFPGFSWSAKCDGNCAITGAANATITA